MEEQKHIDSNCSMLPSSDFITSQEENHTKIDIELVKLLKVEEVFKHIFNDAMTVITKKVNVGGTSSYIYVPKKYTGCHATIIIWHKL